MMKIKGAAQINQIRNESGEITTESSEIQDFMMIYYKQLYSAKLNNLDKKNLETSNFPKNE